MIDVFDSSVNALENYTRILPREQCVHSSFIHSCTHSFTHSFIRQGHSRRASTRRARRRENRSFSLVLSPHASSVVPSSPRASSPIAPPRLRSIDRARGAYLEVTTVRGGGTKERSVSTRVRSIGSTAHLNNLRVDGEHVSRQTRSDDDDDDDDRTKGSIERSSPPPSP